MLRLLALAIGVSVIGVSVIGAVAFALIMAAPADAGSAGRCGGKGGKRTQVIACPDGQYIVGLSASGGAHVNAFGIQCAGFDALGNRGRLGEFTEAGASGGRAKSATCPGNRAVTRIAVGQSGQIDAIHVAICRRRIGRGGFSTYHEGPSRGSFRLDAGRSAPKSTGCSLTCPTKQALYKVKVRHGGRLDSIAGFCRP